MELEVTKFAKLTKPEQHNQNTYGLSQRDTCDLESRSRPPIISSMTKVQQ